MFRLKPCDVSVFADNPEEVLDMHFSGIIESLIRRDIPIACVLPLGMILLTIISSPLNPVLLWDTFHIL